MPKKPVTKSVPVKEAQDFAGRCGSCKFYAPKTSAEGMCRFAFPSFVKSSENWRDYYTHTEGKCDLHRPMEDA